MTDLMAYCGKERSEGLYMDLLARLEHKIPYAWARYGDGEFSAIFHRPGRNSSKHQFFPDLGDRLRDILNSNPAYDLGLQRNAVRRFGLRIAEEFPHVPWTSTEVLHDVSQDRGLTDLFYVLRGRDVVLVGPQELAKGLRKIMDFDHIEVPLIDCWLAYDSVLKTCLSKGWPGRVFVFAAAMMTNVLIDDLFGAEDLTLLDVGAAFDPYAGRKTRKYHRTMKVRMPEWVT